MMSGSPSIGFNTDVTRSIRKQFPYVVEKKTEITIELSDRIKLAATAWIPKRLYDQDTVDEKRFGTILEYLPYRKADWTSKRDELRLKYFASFGYVSLRVDIRGSGNSQGYFDDEYSVQELNDALEILQWIEKQPWSNGKVVIFGKSWGGFNGLQIAALQPKNLAGVISAYSTDDRYSDDIHYIGGCLIAQEALAWSTQMLLWLSIPPHPTYQGGIDRDANLSEIWKDRLEHLVPLDTYWMKHQTRNEYWRHGSVCEDYARIQCPVLLIGGFADLYTDPVFRLMDHLECPKRAIIGPWGHQWPDHAYPGPSIGFLQEVIQWLDYHLKGIDNNYDPKKIITVYQMEPNVDELRSVVDERKGRWIDLYSIAATPAEHLKKNDLSKVNSSNHENLMKFYVSGKWLTTDLPSVQSNPISFQSTQETGLNSGNGLGWGSQGTSDCAIDQREDDAKSLTFESSPINHPIELFGFPLVQISISSNQPNGLICARLCLIDEKTSASILLARGFLNLTHYQSHEKPQTLEIDRVYDIEMKLSSVCLKIPEGNRLRLSLSTCYWPIVWPSSESTMLTIHFHDPKKSCLSLPILDPRYTVRKDFGIPEVAEGLETKDLRPSSHSRMRIIDEIENTYQLTIKDDDGAIQYADGLIFDETSEKTYKINKYDVQSARIDIHRSLKYSFGKKHPFDVDIQLKSEMFSSPSPSAFHVRHHLSIHNHNDEVFNRLWDLTFSRLYN